MLLNDLVQPSQNDIILREAMLTSKNTQDREYITEFLPLIPLALWGAGAAWTAYDAYQAKKAYDRDEITGAELTKMVGKDIALTLAVGTVAKIAGKGWKFGKKIYKSRKAAKAAEKSGMTSAAAAVNTAVTTQVAKSDITADTVKSATANLDNIVAPAAANMVRKAVTKTTKKLTQKQQNALSKMPVAPAAAPVVTNIAKKTTQKLTKKQQDALSKLPTAAAPVVSKTGKTIYKRVKKNNIKKKTDTTKKKYKSRWGLGGGTGSGHDTDLLGFVNKYAFNK